MKKWITLNRRVDIGGEVRFPEEGPIAVDAEHAEKHIASGAAAAAEEPKPGAADLVGKTVPELRETAADEGVALAGAKRKDEIIDAIAEQRIAPAAE